MEQLRYADQVAWLLITPVLALVLIAARAAVTRRGIRHTPQDTFLKFVAGGWPLAGLALSVLISLSAGPPDDVTGWKAKVFFDGFTGPVLARAIAGTPYLLITTGVPLLGGMISGRSCGPSLATPAALGGAAATLVAGLGVASFWFSHSFHPLDLFAMPFLIPPLLNPALAAPAGVYLGALLHRPDPFASEGQ